MVLEIMWAMLIAAALHFVSREEMIVVMAD
jgi:hypothetical protein